jgi:uncharacterized protein
MEKQIQIVFPVLKETVLIKVDDSQSPNTVKAILDNLPIEVNINKWGKEMYTDKTKLLTNDLYEGRMKDIDFILAEL